MLAAAPELPVALTNFIGRERELGQVRDLLASNRLLTFIGPGGIGKTRLALESAASVRARIPNGVWLVQLAPIEDPALVPRLAHPGHQSRALERRRRNRLAGAGPLAAEAGCRRREHR